MDDLAPPLQQVNRTHVCYRGRVLSYFAGCDYFRLARHPAVIQAVHDGLDRYGLNVSASRKTTGNHRLYEQLERELARFFGAEAAVLVSNGYASAMALVQAVAGQHSHVLLDERAHACLVDAAILLDAPIIRFRHRDAAHLQKILRRLGDGCRPLVMTDGMFAHDGTLAPLPEYLRVLPSQALLVVDDSHAAAILGEHGRGTPEHFGLRDRRLVQTITLSKAFGVYGGAVLGRRALVQRIVSHSRLFGGNTPLPLPLANAALTAVKLLRSDKSFRRRLEANTTRVRAALISAGMKLADTPGPLLAVVPRDARAAATLQRRLLAAGIYPSLIHYPGGPTSGYLRLAISSEHTPAQIRALTSALVSHHQSQAHGAR